MKQISSNSIHLDNLLSGLTKENLGNFKNLLIKGISLDSREIGEGFLFCALNGKKANGNDFIEEAFKKGAVFCLTDSKESVLHLTGSNLDPNLDLTGEIKTLYCPLSKILPLF